MYHAPPVGIEVELTNPRVVRPVYPERAVCLAPERGGVLALAVRVQEIDDGGGVLIVMLQIEREITGRLPIRDERVVLQPLGAKRARASGIEGARVDRRIV